MNVISQVDTGSLSTEVINIVMVHRRINTEGMNVLNYVSSYLEDGEIPGRLFPLTTNIHPSTEKHLVPKCSYLDRFNSLQEQIFFFQCLFL